MPSTATKRPLLSAIPSTSRYSTFFPSLAYLTSVWYVLTTPSSIVISHKHQDFTRQTELPFNSERKYMAVSGTHTSGEGSARREMYYIKGSIDAILDRCKFYYVSDDSTPGLDASTRNVIMSKAQSTASRGLRVIAMAYGYGAVESSQPPSVAPSRVGTPVPDKDKSNLVFVGFQAMFDPPRKGVADAINLLQSGGVQIVMITGDAEQTALSIARQLGLRVGPGNSSCLTGREIDSMSKVQLRERVGAVSVFARTTPKHKMAIIEAFQARGAVVAMTGDGGTCLHSAVERVELREASSQRCARSQDGGYRCVHGKERHGRGQRSCRHDPR